MNKKFWQQYITETSKSSGKNFIELPSDSPTKLIMFCPEPPKVISLYETDISISVAQNTICVFLTKSSPQIARNVIIASDFLDITKVKKVIQEHIS